MWETNSHGFVDEFGCRIGERVRVMVGVAEEDVRMRRAERERKQRKIEAIEFLFYFILFFQEVSFISFKMKMRRRWSRSYNERANLSVFFVLQGESNNAYLAV